MHGQNQVKYTNKLHGARVLVIGGSSGLGFAVAEASLEYGALVAISSSNESRIQDAIQRLHDAYPTSKGKVYGVTADLSNLDTLEQELERILKTSKENLGGELDHVIYTAADPLAQISLNDLSAKAIVQAGTLRFTAPLLIAKHLPSYMVPSFKSSYTITTGAISEKPAPNWSIIASYAGGHHAMVRNLALDLKPIRVNGVSPGVVDTGLWRMGEQEKEEFFKACREKLMTGRVPGAEDVAESFLGCMRDWNMDAGIIRTDGGSLFM